jgi:serine protease Do
MTTNPGQSGAPILDDQGNVVAMVAANDRESQGTTYAVTVNAIKQLVHSMPKQMNLRLGKTSKLSKLSREQQLEKLQDYTCLVQVYKK